MRILTEALTFDDVSLVPAYSNVLPRDVSLATRLTRDIRLNIPILSSAMDTVTESALAITMAQCGGIGIIHKNMTVEQQAAEVRLVKKFEAGVIRDPITVTPTTSIHDVMQLVRARNISGVPVVDGVRGVLAVGIDAFANRTQYQVLGMPTVVTPQLAPWVAAGVEVGL